MRIHDRTKVAKQVLFKCSSCLCRAEIRSKQLRPRKPGWPFHGRHEPSRLLSSISSVTAVNASKIIPSSYRDLHEQLTFLGSSAGTFVNLSQLRLASRGLESDNAIVRVAVLGLEGNLGVRRLVRLLLADPLAPDSPWEQHLVDEDGDGRGLLIRHGENYEYDTRHPLLRVLSIPSDVLDKHRLELLISEVASNRVDESLESDGLGLLVPTSATPISASGRASMITYPVHKTLVYGEGVKGFLSSSRIIEKLNGINDKPVISAVVNTQWKARDLDFGHNIVSVNLDQAETAVVELRKSLDKLIDYEHRWLASNLSEVMNRVLEGTQAVDLVLKPAIEYLIYIILASAERSILREETEILQQLSDASPPPSLRQDLDAAITVWAETAHTELQDSLEKVLQGKIWRKLAWFKLFWRVDDVGMLATDIMHRSWLVEAEKGIIWVGGGICQAGLLDPDQYQSGKVNRIKEINMPKFGSEPPSPLPRHTKQKVFTSSHGAVIFDPAKPWSQYILSARYSLSSITIPPLQALSQRLLLQTISTTTATSALSILIYFSLSTTSIYEAGAVAALGLVYSLRRLQRKWEAARTEWIEHIREEGRRVLRNVEDVHREVVREGGKPEMDETGVEERAAAREAIRRVREALEKVKSGKVT